ncbi:MAG: hypothetical protein H0X62_05665 [Bacteroidetes bacterium]|nr:hypothetical protein [Bacteroidota bacterium]
MKFLSERISVSETKGSTSIIISPDYSDSKQSLLTTWIIFWTLGGLVIISQLFGHYSQEEKAFLFVWVVFWLYFEYIGLFAWLWKKYGKEKIILKNEKVLYAKNLKSKNKFVVMEQESITEINRLKNSEKNLLYNLSNSYWNRGNETCEFRYHGKNIRFGLKLTEEEASKLVSLLKNRIK